MPVSGPRSPGTTADDSGVGTVAWTNTSNATASDDSHASTSDLAASVKSHYLKLTNFGFAVPTATIDGIEANIEWKGLGSFPPRQYRVRIVKAGTISTDTTFDSSDLLPAWGDLTDTFGGPTSLWGTTWNASDINNSGFGVAIACQGGWWWTGTAHVDHVTLTVYYTNASPTILAVPAVVAAVAPLASGASDGARVEMAFTPSDPANPQPGDWESLGDAPRTVSIQRGRTFPLDTVEAATCVVSCNNAGGELDPANPGSGRYPNVVPLRPLRVIVRRGGVSYPRFTGRVERFVPSWAQPSWQFVDIEASDVFEQLANVAIESDHATLTTALSGSNNDLVFTAREAGGDGDNITVTYVVSGTNTNLGTGVNDPNDILGNVIQRVFVPAEKVSSLLTGGLGKKRSALPKTPLGVQLSGSDITVTSATSGGGSATTTANQVRIMLTGGEQELANPVFATDTSFWSIFASSGSPTLSRQTGDADFGTCGQAALTGSSAGNDMMVYTQHEHPSPVSAGDTINLQVSVKSTVGTLSQFTLWVRWMDDAGGFLSESLVDTQLSPVNGTVYGMDGAAVTPEGATRAGLELKGHVGSGTAITYRFDNASLIVDRQSGLVTAALASGNSGAGTLVAMSQTHLSGGKWDMEYTGTRIDRVLDEIGYAAPRALDDGEAQVVAQGFNLKQNVSALAHIQEVADSELGYVFVAGDGTFTYHDGARRTVEDVSTLPQVMFSDGTNQFLNPSFEDGTDGWEADDSGTATAVLAQVADATFSAGAFAGEVSVTGATASDGAAANSLVTQRVHTSQGETVAASVQVKKVSGSISSVSLDIRWFDSTDAFISQTGVDSQSSPVNGTIYTLEGSAAAPANARWAGISVIGTMSGASGVYRLDDGHITGTYQPFRQIQMVSLDKDKIANRVNVTAGVEGAAAQSYDDPDSQARYGVRVLDRQTRLAETSDAQAHALALLAAFKDPHVYVEAITLLDDGTTEWAEDVLAREIGDRITIRFSPPVADEGDAYQFAQDCFIEGIEDTKNPGEPWQVRFQLSSVDQNVAIPLATDKTES
jgi:hypothetical protein